MVTGSIKNDNDVWRTRHFSEIAHQNALIWSLLTGSVTMLLVFRIIAESNVNEESVWCEEEGGASEKL